MSWRKFTDFAKRKQLALRLAAHLGRGRGGMRFLDDLRTPKPPARVPDLTGWENRELSAVWIGHATLLLRIEGMTVLTDPVFSSRVGIGLWFATGGPMRAIAPALSIRQLPRVDLILISHAHFDHLDMQSMARLPRSTPVVTAYHTQDLVHHLGFRNVKELKWGEQTRIGNLGVTARQVTHWGARTFLDQHRGFNAYLLESPHRRVLYGGDTAYFEGFKDIGKVDLAIFGIGAYDPYIRAHATPEQAWAMAQQVRADYVLPIHHSTFRLSHEPMEEPIARMLAAAGSEADRVVIREVGGTWTAPPRPAREIRQTA